VPLYEYECAKDGRFELIRKFSDPPLSKCPTCGRPVEKLFSSPAIQFKGTGWYITDYARKGNGSPSSKESGKDSGNDSPKDGGKDSASKESSAKADSSPQTTPSPKEPASGSSSTK